LLAYRELDDATDHMTELKGRTYDCSVPFWGNSAKILAIGAVPHLSENRTLASPNFVNKLFKHMENEKELRALFGGQS